MGSLVSTLLRPVTRGLEALQKEGMTPRLWRRLSEDHAFAEKVMSLALECDVDLVGEDFEIEIEEAQTRETLCEKLHAGCGRDFALNADLLRHFRPTANSVPGKQTLFLTPIWSHLSRDEIDEELAARKLVSASFEDALAFSLRFALDRNNNRSIYVPGAVVDKWKDCVTEPEMLSLGYTLGGIARMSLWKIARGIPAPSLILTKRAQA